MPPPRTRIPEIDDMATAKNVPASTKPSAITGGAARTSTETTALMPYLSSSQPTAKLSAAPNWKIALIWMAVASSSDVALGGVSSTAIQDERKKCVIAASAMAAQRNAVIAPRPSVKRWLS